MVAVILCHKLSLAKQFYRLAKRAGCVRLLYFRAECVFAYVSHGLVRAIR